MLFLFICWLVIFYKNSLKQDRQYVENITSLIVTVSGLTSSDTSTNTTAKLRQYKHRFPNGKGSQGTEYQKRTI